MVYKIRGGWVGGWMSSFRMNETAASASDRDGRIIRVTH